MKVRGYNNILVPEQEELQALFKVSVADPDRDPHGSASFDRIRNFVGSGS
jgi:hypothetical protein